MDSLYTKRHRCCTCRKLTYRWQKVNGSPYHCYDGCYSTTGWDRRSPDGKPIWLKKPTKAKWKDPVSA